MRRQVASFALLIAAALVAGANGCSSDEYVVGGECAVPLVQCGQRCVDVESDPQNCGGCGQTCGVGVACVGGQCGGSLDGSTDGSRDGAYDGAPPLGDGATDGASTDGTSYEGGSKDGSTTGDSGETDGPTGDGASGDGATGDGATEDANDAASDADAGPTCTPPEVSCDGVCTDTTSDPANCGGCGTVCPAFLCAASMCLSGFNGEAVLIGHDFASAIPPNGAQQTVLTNTVFIRPSSPLRILAYDRYANPAATARVSSILTAHGAQTSQPIAYTETMTDSTINSTLNIANYDVLFVYDQANASHGTLAALGSSWASTLATYLGAGGFIVVLDGAGGTTQEMGAFMTSAGLFTVTSQIAVAAGTRVDNTAINDSVGRNVAFYGVTNDSARFLLDAPSASVAYVFTDLAANQPVVVHKTF